MPQARGGPTPSLIFLVPCSHSSTDKEASSLCSVDHQLAHGPLGQALLLAVFLTLDSSAHLPPLCSLG